MDAELKEILDVDATTIERLSKPGPRYTSYPTAPEWSEDIAEKEAVSRLQTADREGADSPLSLYFHLPFCREMCTFCGCTVIVTNREERIDRYLDYVVKELDLVVAHLPTRRKVGQLHLGGGTPTFLSVAQLSRLWEEVTKRFDILPDAEVALEADPCVTTKEQLDLLRGFGFSRISMGVQDFTPEVQEYVNRIQPEDQTRELYEHARKLGFRGINFDLIFGLPKQQPETFAKTLDAIVDMRPDRIALFSYAHVPWIRPHQRKFDEALLPNASLKFQLFTQSLKKFIQADYLQIGMDHFSVADDELAQARLARRLRRNFQGYTVNPASDTISFGMSGIGDVAGAYLHNFKSLPKYYERLDNGELPTERGMVLTEEDKLRRHVIHEIMCNFYVSLQDSARLFGRDDDYFAPEIKKLAEVEDAGLIKRNGVELEVTPLGRILVRNVAMVFDTYLGQKTGGQTFSKTI
jgi:oxygen-independent coproporphyrinogen III oxidase